MYLKLRYCNKVDYNRSINICGSKSETNRLLIIKKLYKNVYIRLSNTSNSNDAKLMALSLRTRKNVINVQDAGTVMRFLVAYFSILKDRTVILTGTERMKKRPIYHLVKALNKIGCDIKYMKNIGYPPILIKGKKIYKNKIKINSKISSQYISSLILIGPKLKNGLIIKLSGDKISLSYIKLTISILKKLKFNIKFRKNYIIIKPFKSKSKEKIKYNIESDWSSASYFYSIISILDRNKKIILKKYKRNSLQGDSKILFIYYKYFGIVTKFKNKHKIIIKKKKNFIYPKYFTLDLKSTPDIAQTIIVTCALLKIKCLLTGLKTLKIKETDRLIALQNELKKIGVFTIITNNSIEIIKFKEIKNYNKNIIINTYKDHRMAMSFSVLAIKNEIFIENPKTVNKSYPNFWNDLKKIGFNLKMINNI
ncbi:MAG: 3-phosphoshikimate 1-carboxyvinyltransferase [Candidatus Shikimatogenerans bostrichidophilus]|nr:MAG: 3-phosphoshikimate 1-carboxyvinyltransferase [Candidatus Shikimatogenerans bostrichidophilus]